jgi:hypothetical protein
MLLLKLTLVPLLIALISVAGAPIVAAPIWAILVVEHGTDFGAEAAFGTVAGLVSLACFAITYAWLCRSVHWLLSVMAAWCVFLALSLALNELQLSSAAAGLAGMSAPMIGTRLFPHLQGSVQRRPLPRSEIALRMVAAAALVWAITQAASVAGPRLAGLLTPVPVATSVLAVFSHRLSGAYSAIQLLRGIVTGLYGFASFFIVAGLSIQTSGLALSCVLALAACVLAQGLTYYAMFRIGR